jgi:hypothetical protein
MQPQKLSRYKGRRANCKSLTMKVYQRKESITRKLITKKVKKSTSQKKSKRPSRKVYHRKVEVPVEWAECKGENKTISWKREELWGQEV